MDLFKLTIDFFDRQVQHKPDLRTGSKELDYFLQSHFRLSFLDKIDLASLDAEFKDKVIHALSCDKVSSDIRSIYFGLLTFAGDSDDTSLTAVHVAGSKSTPEENVEWACDIDYKNQNYINLEDFALIDSSLAGELDNKGIIEVVIFNGLLNLLVINSIDVIKALTFNGSERQSLWLGTGFDSGDCFVLAEVRA